MKKIYFVLAKLNGFEFLPPALKKVYNFWIDKVIEF